MLIPPQESPCPNCKQLLWHSFLGIPRDELTPDPVPHEIKEIWTDGFIVDADFSSSTAGPVLPEFGEFIAKCPKCAAVFPDHFIPWSRHELSGPAEERFVLAPSHEPVGDFENALIQCNLNETIQYIEHLNRNGSTATWECWTAIQQTIFLANHALRHAGGLSQAGIAGAKSAMRIMTTALEGSMEGAWAERSQLPRDSERRGANLPKDWATFCDMYRIAGDFSRAEQYLKYAISDIEQGIFDPVSREDIYKNLYAQQRFRKERARVDLLLELIDERSDVAGTSSRLFLEGKALSIKKVFTFYINDEDSDIGVFGQVAQSREEVEANLTRKGFNDFFLFEERDLLPEEVESAADFRVKLSPHLGPNWIPVVNAIQRVIEDTRSTFFSIGTFAKKYGFNPHESPYIQGMVLEDGRFHLEAPQGFLEQGRLSVSKIDQLKFIGWNMPGDTDSTFNLWRVFDYGWNSRFVAEFALETLTSVLGVEETDFFDFGSVWQPEVVWALQELHRVRIDELNPKGSIFRIPDDSQYRIESFKGGIDEGSLVVSSDPKLTPYPDSHEVREAKYIESLKELMGILIGLRVADAIERLEDAINSFEIEGFRSSVDKATEFLSAVEAIPEATLASSTLEAIRTANATVRKAIDAFPFPLGTDKEVLFEHLPPGLQELIADMVERVLQGGNGADRDVVATLAEFMGNKKTLLESEIQQQMGQLLRILTRDS